MKEKFLRALGTLYNMAIDNTKGSRAVEICVNDIQNYVQQKENIIKEVREYIKSNEKEYGSLEDNEKIILGILDKEVS